MALALYRLQPAEDAVRRYTEELWFPFNRELERTVESFDLADTEESEIVAEEVEFRREWLEAEGNRAWVVVEGADGDPDGSDGPDEGESVELDDRIDEDVDPAAVDGAFVAFLTTHVDESPSVFDRPDRLGIGDIYVDPAYRGTGLALRLVERAAERAREEGYPELRLDVDVENERAIAFYEKLGFEPYRHRMNVAVSDLE